ncbi:MAG: rhodanese-like domain-containing protein [Pseudomonadota bacterium]
MSAPAIDICTPDEAWKSLEADPSAALIDVRTRAEWSFVGIPDIGPLGRETVLIEWAQFPTMAPNPAFAEAVLSAVEPKDGGQLFFICRSGARSRDAAHLVKASCAEQGVEVRCVNVDEGFEGDLNTHSHRGVLNGWKARGLPWRQS